jgi:SAM-dependent methyltransferase
MKHVDRIHGSYVHGRRVQRLSKRLAGLLPARATVLDVGCGDGKLGRLLADTRPDIDVAGIDVLVREGAHIPVAPFDGQTLPQADRSVDVVLFVDVLHHTDDPAVLLREARRVARRAIVLKDHTADGFLSRPTLRFMDHVGNARYGVSLPYNYWPRRRWLKTFDEISLRITAWHDRLELYPKPADWIFGRSLHFVARLEPAAAQLNSQHGPRIMPE